ECARHLADRLVAARAGRADREVQAGRGAARGDACDVGVDGAIHGPRARPDAPRTRAAVATGRERARDQPRAARARLGPARAQRRFRNRRRVAPGTDRGQRRRRRHRARCGDAGTDRRDPRRQRRVGRPGVVDRDVAVVLSGGAVNGVLMELGFLQRLRESSLWPRVGWIYGTSAGALAGTMAALDRLDELEDFMLKLQPEETFRPHSLWRLPLLGSHDYRLPQTVAERIGDLVPLAAELASAPIEVTVFATDVSNEAHGEGHHAYELAYSSRTT